MESSLCNSDCHCEFVKYSPVCGNDGMTYISACHAGCRNENKLLNGTKVRIESNNIQSSSFERFRFSQIVTASTQTLKTL
jgi:Kazal-type serine protease inhibitor domain